MRSFETKRKNEAIANFQYDGLLVEECAYGNGHINDTFLLTFDVAEMGSIKVILQRMNKTVFKNPAALMENIEGVTGHLRKKIVERGGDVNRETLNVIPALDGRPYYVDTYGQYWRSYRFITGATSYERVRCPEDFYQSAVAFGAFQRDLSDYPAETLHETIPGFHDTQARLEAFKRAVQEDICGRAREVQEEIDFVLEREDMAHILLDMQKKGDLPLRVTHNDTKLNNIMIDDKTGKGICVIDLDTVMPGLSINDFGDSIRFGASTALEDERDLSKVSCDLNLYEAYVKGYIEGCGGKLTEKEIEMLPLGAKVMTYECGVRFLTDYLQGDKYFKVHREKHNLDRCRTQFKLVKDMEEKWDEMMAIVAKY